MAVAARHCRSGIVCRHLGHLHVPVGINFGAKTLLEVAALLLGA
jgi:xanthine/CO dehydrogenase XdhC/CoxF family maturation factor